MTAAATTHPSTTLQVREIPLEQLVASKTNPRTHFAEQYLDELAVSIAEKGLIQPIVVRPLDVMRAVLHYPEAAAKNGAKYEIVAGECRFRASKRAGMAAVASIVREYTDEQVLEIQLVENLHRTDLTPLEQAVGYRRLIDTNPTKHSAESIARRIGMSPAWVWDRLKLNDLVPEAKQLLEQELISIGHAILIARLKPEDQERTIKIDRSRGGYEPRAALWRNEHGFNFDAADQENKGKTPGKYDGVKACSIRELERWITENIRFDVQHAAKATPLQFEPTAAAVEAAAAQPGRGKKVVSITHSYRVPDGARDEQERTYGSESWVRADGQVKSKTCEYSVLGVVVAGQGYGDTFQVCVNRDKCLVHWGPVIRQREKTQKLRESGETGKAGKREQAWQVKQRREQEERERKEQRWKVFGPALKKAVHDKLATLKAVPTPVYAHVLKFHRLPTNTKPADLPMALLRSSIDVRFNRYSWAGDEADQVAWAKLLGVDVKALKPKSEKAPASKKVRNAGKQ